MEKLFTPSKWFVLFCALFIAVFVALQFVVTTRLETVAEKVGEDIFTWVWFDKNLCSSADMNRAKVIKLNPNDAIVEISGEQTLCPFDEKLPSQWKTEKNSCRAVLTFYKLRNGWALGKVELE
jgi:hypothetical protein